MRRILTINILIMAFSVSNAFAQMGHGMMREMPGGTMHEHMIGHEGLMSHEQMVGNLKEMMNELAGLMGNMAGMMKDMPKAKMNKMSSLIKDMGSEMSRISEMVGTGSATDEEMRMMRDRITEMQKKMSEMMKK